MPPSKRRRGSCADDRSKKHCTELYANFSLGEASSVKRQTLTLTNIKLILTELSRLQKTRPTSIPEAVPLASLLAELWDSYLTECTKIRDLEVEWHMLQSSNKLLKAGNFELESTCVVKGGIVRDNQQSLQSVREGVLGLFQSMRGYQTFLSSCN